MRCPSCGGCGADHRDSTCPGCLGTGTLTYLTITASCTDSPTPNQLAALHTYLECFPSFHLWNVEITSDES